MRAKGKKRKSRRYSELPDRRRMKKKGLTYFGGPSSPKDRKKKRKRKRKTTGGGSLYLSHRLILGTHQRRVLAQTSEMGGTGGKKGDVGRALSFSGTFSGERTCGQVEARSHKHREEGSLSTERRKDHWRFHQGRRTLQLQTGVFERVEKTSEALGGALKTRMALTLEQCEPAGAGVARKGGHEGWG